MNTTQNNQDYCYYIKDGRIHVSDDVDVVKNSKNEMVCVIYVDKDGTKNGIVIYDVNKVKLGDITWFAGTITAIKESNVDIYIKDPDSDDEKAGYVLRFDKRGLVINEQVITPLYKVNLINAKKCFA